MSAPFAVAADVSDAVGRRVHADYEGEVAGLRYAGLALPVQRVGVIHIAPWLFSDVAPSIDDDARTTIAVAALLYRDYLLAFDAPIDGDAPIDPVRLLAAGLYHERALTRLAEVVPNESEMWSTLARLARQHVAAAAEERARTTADWRGPAWSFDAYAHLAAAKAAVLTAIPAACCAAAGLESLVDTWDEVIAPLSVAEQLRDDLTDWRDDWLAGRLTFVHIRALAAAGLLDPTAGRPRLDADTLGHHVFHSGVASELLADAVDACEASMEAAEARRAYKWTAFARYVRISCEQQITRVSQQRARFAALGRRSLQPGGVRSAVDRLLCHLSREHAAGYPSASHRMKYERAGSPQFVRPGGDAPDMVHEGAVFHRAIIGWFYDRCEHSGIPVLSHLVDENLDALLALRVHGEVLWSYHPTIAGLPPDLDDLAQILHAFLARRSRDLDAIFRRPVRIAIDGQQATGAIETWMIDPALDAGWRAWYAKQIDEYWGPGAEAEVVANFASALLAWHPHEYAPAANRAASFVASEQLADGSWSSTWYVGPLYGTFVATRLLRTVSDAVEAATPALERARDFLLRGQHVDGGWGVDAGASDTHSTALAVLALAGAARGADDADARRAIERGAQWLVFAQRDDGSWQTTVNFIRFDLNRRAPEYGEQWRYFRSATTTSAFAGAALLAAAPWLHG